MPPRLAIPLQRHTFFVPANGVGMEPCRGGGMGPSMGGGHSRP